MRLHIPRKGSLSFEERERERERPRKREREEEKDREGRHFTVIHEQIYILLSCNRRRADRGVIEGGITPSSKRKYQDRGR